MMSIPQSLLEQAIQISPDWPMLRIETTYLLLNLGQFGRAKQEIEQAVFFQKQSFKTSENAVENYYETAITGKGWTNLTERLDQLKRSLIKSKEEYKRVNVISESDVSKLDQIRTRSFQTTSTYFHQIKSSDL